MPVGRKEKIQWAIADAIYVSEAFLHFTVVTHVRAEEGRPVIGSSLLASAIVQPSRSN